MARLKADALIVGAGVVGLFTAYFLGESLGLTNIIVEKNPRPGMGVSARSANVIHVLQPPFNSLKSRLCIKGNRLYHKLAEAMGFKLYEVPLILAILKPYMKPVGWAVSKILKRILPREFNVYYAGPQKLKSIEPLLSDKVAGGVVVEGYAVVDYNSLIESLEKNARRHAEILTGEELIEAEVTNTMVLAKTRTLEVKAKLAINAGGLEADNVARILGDNNYRITPLKGVMSIHPKPRLKTILAPLELRRGETKGGGAIPQATGNTLLGPNNAGPTRIGDEAYTPGDLEWLRNRFQPLIVEDIAEPTKVIVGLRPVHPTRDFIIEWSPKGTRVIHLVGIESPGLTAAPAIAQKIIKMIKARF